jgi:delta24(24(1))-sterol reductase
MVMIIHRARRDIDRCRRKYGDAWLEYEKAVPYLFIPVSCIFFSSNPLVLPEF